MVCLARVILRIMVASGTKKARATSAVVSPPIARSVSAICDAGDKAGWQHMKSRISVSSESAAGRSAGGASQSSGSACWAIASSRRWRACSRRSRSMSRRDATVMSQARGLPGRPLPGHCAAAEIRASCTASSARSKCPYRRTRAPRTCGASCCSRSSTSRSDMGDQSSSSARESTIGRTSATAAAASTGPGHCESRAAIVVARSKLAHSTIQ